MLEVMTLSGDQLNVEGSLDIAIPDIRVVTFIVVCNMAQEDSMGLGQISKHGWSH